MKKVILLSALVLALASCSAPAVEEQAEVKTDSTCCVKADTACVEKCDSTVVDTVKK